MQFRASEFWRGLTIIQFTRLLCMKWPILPLQFLVAFLWLRVFPFQELYIVSESAKSPLFYYLQHL